MVGLDEVKYAIVPSDINSDVTTALNKAGIETKTYENGNEADRLKVLNTLSDVRFSKQLDTDTSSAITQADVEQLRSIGRKSISEFTSEDIQKSEKWAKKFYSELGTKSPFFRAWFGDWRENDTGKTNVTSVSDISAYDALETMPTGTFTNKDSDWAISAGAVGRRDTNSHSGREKVSVKMLSEIKNIIENAVLLDTDVSEKTSSKKHNETLFMHKLYSPVIFNNDLYIAKVTVEEYGAENGGRRFYNLKGIKIDPAGGTPDAKTSYGTMPDTRSEYSISDLYALVKDYDKDFKSQPSSKVVNEDGSPKVVYHGTTANFTEFKASNGALGKGIYFTDSKDFAKGYTYQNGAAVGNVMECYLDIKNPYIVKYADNYDTDALREKGYDGILHEATGMYVAFDPTQIKSVDNLGTFDKSKSDIRYSKQLDKYDYSKSFSEQIEDYKNGIIPKYDTLVVGKTPEVFTKIGLNPLPMTYGTGHLSDILKGNVQDHDFGEANLKQIPKALESPVAIISSKTKPNSSVVAILDLSYNSKPMFAAVEIDGYGQLNGERVDSNAITTIHTRSNAINQLTDAIINESPDNARVFYIDNKKATNLYNASGVQFPGGKTVLDGYVHSIRDSGSPVNIKIENVTNSQQFKRWFGDWENHPQAASKVVNSDGTPKVVYHGTNADFWTFSLANRGKNGEKLGVGYYFVDNKSSAERYGDRVIEAYLDIKKPASAEVMEISRKDWEKFLDFAMEHRDEYIDGEWKGNEINKEYELIDFDYGSNDAELIKGFLNGIAAGNKDVTEAYLEMLKDSTGYDGIAYNTDNTDYYVAFTPEQIKSATDNIGTFDKDNKDIRYSKELMTVEEKKKIREAERAAYLERQLVSTAPLGGKAKAVSPTAKAAVAKKIASGMPGVSTAQVNEQLTKFFDVIEHPKATQELYGNISAFLHCFADESGFV